MCSSDQEPVAPFAPGAPSTQASPRLDFVEPEIPIPDIHRDEFNANDRVYEVADYTSLGPTPSFRYKVNLLNLNEGSGQSSRSSLREEPEQCENRDCPRLKPNDRDEQWLKSWTGDVDFKNWGFKHRPVCFGESLFARVFKFAFVSRVVACRHPQCQSRKAALFQSSPACRWAAFREYVITLVACWTPVRLLETIFSRIFSKDGNTASPKRLCIDLQGMVEVFVWARRLVEGPRLRGIFGLQGRLGLAESTRPAFREAWGLLTPTHDARALEFARRCHAHGICPARIWNISLLSPYGVESVLHIAKVIIKVPSPRSKAFHLHCTDQHCSISITNSTLARQAHKCEGDDCQETRFPPDVLNDAFQREAKTDAGKWCNSAWQIIPDGVIPPLLWQYEAPLCEDPGSSYMAISHVWSDGTGVGMKSPGSVNRCLFEYFRTIALDLGCNGIWWDTISLPTSREAKTFALNNMLQNYERAKITLIHDEDLVNFKWRDDGSPAVALILSSWFTRGWTAAELWASRNHEVKVIFAAPEGEFENGAGHKYVLKDLDRDVLAHDLESFSPTRRSELAKLGVKRGLDFSTPVPGMGHLVATDIIILLRRVEGNSYKNPFMAELSDLLQILRPRTTSWAIDQMVIAGLLGLPSGEFRAEWNSAEITQRVLIQFSQIRTTDLIHGEVPIAPYGGPWEWCPRSLFDLGRAFSGSDPTDDNCKVSADGRLLGSFHAFEVHKDDHVLPYGSHPAHRARVTLALSEREKHLFLTTADLVKSLIYILFRPTCVYVNRVVGNWIGCVVLQRPPNTRKWLFPDEIAFGFGGQLDTDGNMLPALNAQQLLWAYKSSRLNRWLPNTACVLTEATSEDVLQAKPKWLPQQMWIFKPDVASQYEGGESGKLVAPQDLFVNAIIVFDFSVQENRINAAFAYSLPRFAYDRNAQGESDTVELTWSFPHAYLTYYECPVTRHIFKSQFQVVPGINKDGETWSIPIGRDTFDQCIKANMTAEDVPLHMFSLLQPTAPVKYGKAMTIHHTQSCTCEKCLWYGDTDDLFAVYPGPAS
ncbi:putative Heterokaryon incompatibility domain-containing protein [Seiridium unicorne]|uniref:Heterokaryon incompatibility domain-containing protein n=1 Tax=Seiridium unicorne TaxID=138068 RepID=A0ABR2UKP7_9PEZI